MNRPAPTLSIVIATYNRAASLLRALESLSLQTLDPDQWEVVVVNNNSTDDTPAVVTAFSGDHPELQIRLLKEPVQGLSPARNAGIRVSRGSVIAIIDDDETVNPEFAAAYVAFFEGHPEAAGGGGAVVPVYECDPPRWLTPWAARPITGQLDLGPDVRPFPKGKYPPGGNMAVRREMLDRYGLFDPALGRTGTKPLGGEEKELFGRLRAGGEAIYYIPGAVINHYIPTEKLTPDYFDRVNLLGGASERLRTLNQGRGAYFLRLVGEGIKWAAAIFLCLGYTLRFQPLKGVYLVRQRWQISRGLVGE